MSNLGPIAEKRPHTVHFGKVEGENRGENPMVPTITHEDPYFWLRCDKREDPDVIAHLKQEEAFYNESTKDIQDLKDTIYQEHISHTQETDTSDPYVDGEYAYYSRTVKDLSYRIYCRVAKGEVAGGDKEEIIMDVNERAKGLKHCEIRSLEHSPDHSQFIYSIDSTGNEVFEIRCLNEAAIPDVITGTNGDVEWGTDNSLFFYSTKDDTLRDNKIWMHRVGTKQEDDVLLYSEDDEIFSAFMGKSLDGKSLIVGSSSSETTECHLINIDALKDSKKDEAVPLLTIRKREKGIRYMVNTHDNDTLIISTNADKCVNNKVVVATRQDPSNWSNVLIEHDKDVFIDDVIVFKKFMALGGRQDGLTKIWTVAAVDAGNGSFKFEKRADMLKAVPVPEQVYSHELVSKQNCDYEAATFRAVYSSFTTPSTWIDYCPFTHASKQIKVREVGGGFDSKNYVCERRFAKAPDGTDIAMSLVYRKDLDMSKPNPAMIYGYGSYGICMDPSFAISYLPYCDRGMVYVMTHIRGGGENGRSWYEVQGKYLTKRNTFSDFIACAEYLVSSGITTPAQLACEGRSAGGLLIGAVINQRPDLFEAAIAGVPFVDVMTTMCDASIPLTTGEWEEWGNPNEMRYYDYMLSYSPMDNIKAQNYPNILMVAGLHDPRVAYWEPTKWATKLRVTKQNTNNTEILLKMDMDAGHFSASDRYKYLREKAIEQAWVIKHVIKRLK